MRFHQVDTWLTPFVTDDSDVSTFSMAPHAVLFRELGEGVPYLLDWLVTACPDDKETLRRLIDSLMSCRSTVGPKGVFTRLIKREDLGPVLYWLLQSTSEQQLIFWELMDRVLLSSLKAADPLPPVELLPPSAQREERLRVEKERAQAELRAAALAEERAPEDRDSEHASDVCLTDEELDAELGIPHTASDEEETPIMDAS